MRIGHLNGRAQLLSGDGAVDIALSGPSVARASLVMDPPGRRWINDELVQDCSTDQMMLLVPELIERISAVCTLYPGDLVFTGTPAAVELDHGARAVAAR